MKNYAFLLDYVGLAYEAPVSKGIRRNWKSYEELFLDVILRCFCAIGIVDLAFAACASGDEGASVKVSAIRLNSFGAYILGMESDYVPKEQKATESGLVVTPDFCVLITGKKAILEHSPYLSQFFAQSRGSDESVTFKIDILGLFKALDQDTPGDEIMERLTSASQMPVPDNVLRTWESWIEKSSKIRFRKATLIEMEDKERLAEWSENAAQDGLLFRNLESCAAEIAAGDLKKVKRLLEKNGRYVRL
jgi:hypothetical protein